MTSGSSGYVLGFHCVPATVEPAVEAFWIRLSKELREVGQTLVVVSTVPLVDADLPVISIPFQMTDFMATGQERLPDPSDPEVQDAVTWYRCSTSQAQRAVGSLCAFIEELLAVFQPTAILGWQSMNPVTRLARRLARGQDIPFWTVERGWVRGTLMIDLCENNFLSEVTQSLSLATLAERLPFDKAAFDLERQRLTAAAGRSRYESSAYTERQAFRLRYGIPEDEAVTVLFTHGEPHINSVARPRIRQNHRTSRECLQAELTAIAHEICQRGQWLLVQEHPFNAQSRQLVDLPELPKVMRVTESVDTLFDGADRFLFTLSTIQFDAVVSGKRFGLLSKSLLALKGGAPQRCDYPSTGDFLTAIEDETRWPARQEVLNRRIGFLLEHVLLRIDDEAHRAQSAQRVARHLASFCSVIPDDIDNRLDDFLSRWTTAG